MWTRLELKTRAKASLRGSYWSAFAVSLILLFTTGGGPSFNFNLGPGHNGPGTPPDFSTMPPEAAHWLLQMLPVIIGAVIVTMLFMLALRIFICYPLEMGGRRYFIEASQGRVDMGVLVCAFNRQMYKNTVLTLFLRDLRLLGWTLLLIIPGIVKGYAYRFVPYILSDNPHLAPARAIELSNRMTRGHKMDMFILDLSFLGWYLLGLLALVVGTLFVHPYVNATMAELYATLKANALQNGIADPKDLGSGFTEQPL